MYSAPAVRPAFTSRPIPHYVFGWSRTSILDFVLFPHLLFVYVCRVYANFIILNRIRANLIGTRYYMGGRNRDRDSEEQN